MSTPLTPEQLAQLPSDAAERLTFLEDRYHNALRLLVGVTHEFVSGDLAANIMNFLMADKDAANYRPGDKQ